VIELANEGIGDISRGALYRFTTAASKSHFDVVKDRVDSVLVLSTVCPRLSAVPATDGGLLSAYGLGKAPIERFRSRTVLERLDRVGPDLTGWIARLGGEARRAGEAEGSPAGAGEVRRRSGHPRRRCVGWDLALPPPTVRHGRRGAGRLTARRLRRGRRRRIAADLASPRGPGTELSARGDRRAHRRAAHRNARCGQGCRPESEQPFEQCGRGPVRAPGLCPRARSVRVPSITMALARSSRRVRGAAAVAHPRPAHPRRRLELPAAPARGTAGPWR